MNRSEASRTAQQSSDLLKTLMNSYALAAGAAGVSLMALAQPANAEIVYTPQNSTIPLAPELVSIDINHDGTPDFAFFFYTFAYHSFRATVNVIPVAGAGVIVPGGNGGGGHYAAALFAGNNIGGSRSFGGEEKILIRTHGTATSFFYHRSVKGLWSNVANRYLGVRFKDSEGANHFGWIRLTVSDARRPDKATITGYAYETVADQPIKAGQLNEQAKADSESMVFSTASLGELALGSSRLPLWRREDSLLSAQ